MKKKKKMAINWDDNKICELLFGRVKGLEELYDQQKPSKGHLPLLFGKSYLLFLCFEELLSTT